jgi:hypothetical protein
LEPNLHDKIITIFVNWLNDVETSEAEKKLKELKQEHAKSGFQKSV